MELQVIGTISLLLHGDGQRRKRAAPGRATGRKERRRRNMPYVSLSLSVMHGWRMFKNITAAGGQYRYLQSTYLHVFVYSTVISRYTYLY